MSLDPELLDKLRRGFRLELDRQGNFHFEGDPLTHPGVVALFRAGLDESASGEAIVHAGAQWAYLRVADLPLRALRVVAGERGWPMLVLDDGRCLALDPAGLWEETDAGLRCRVPSQVSGRLLGVRLTNTAAMDLSAWMVWADDLARPELAIGEQRWPIPDSPPSAAA